MLRRLLILLLLLLAPAAAQAQNITPELVAEGRAVPGGEVELAIHMRPKPGWHGYWLNPGDAGLPMQVEWKLPPGFSAAPLRYPVPTRLTVAGLMNYVYKGDYALLTRLKVPAGVTGTIPIRASATWLACTDKVCVPEQGEFALNLPTGGMATADTRFNEWRRALPRPLVTPAVFEVRDNLIRVGIPLPKNVDVGESYLFPATDGPVDYAGKQRFLRSGDQLIAELPTARSPPLTFSGVLAFGDGRGIELTARSGDVPDDGTPISGKKDNALLWAVLGALLGGIVLNLMPCVFPILAIKALHLARSGGEEREARRDALAYAGGAILGTGALGLALLAIRAGGTAAGWAFQLQDPRTIMLLMLLAVAITLNLLRVFELPVVAGSARPAGSFGAGALAAFVATPCAGPFMGAALGTALLLPIGGSVLVFAALGLGLALPFVAVAFVPALRRRLPSPGPWMQRLQRFLAIPMAATAIGCLWLLSRQGGNDALIIGVVAVLVLGAALAVVGQVQRRGTAYAWTGAALALVTVAAAVALVPSQSAAAKPSGSSWSHDAVRAATASGSPAFVYFTADWCLTCKANEAAAINRATVKSAFEKAGVKVFVGDWTDGEPTITRFLESRGRAGVPLYLWYEPGKAEPEELPQILTPSMLTSRARRAR
jgi:DsbC/DsbD-like thiol-disulfide interchange protein/cytochrome c biogenesis protein CcdA